MSAQSLALEAYNAATVGVTGRMETAGGLTIYPGSFGLVPATATYLYGGMTYGDNALVVPKSGIYAFTGSCGFGAASATQRGTIGLVDVTTSTVVQWVMSGTAGNTNETLMYVNLAIEYSCIAGHGYGLAMYCGYNGISTGPTIILNGTGPDALTQAIFMTATLRNVL